jgi:hypothetical protein
VVTACGAAGSAPEFGLCGAEPFWVNPMLEKVKTKTAVQDMRALAIKPGMGKFLSFIHIVQGF